MKILLIILLLPTSSFCQNIKTDNHVFVYEKVYPLDGMDSASIARLLIEKMPAIPDLTDFKFNEGTITARLHNAFIHYKKCGGHWISAAGFLNSPYDANVTALWKNGKYKIQVSNIYFLETITGKTNCNDIFFKNNGKERKGELIVQAKEYIDCDLSAIFALKRDSTSF